MWRAVSASVIGTSHEKRGQPCQDAAWYGSEGEVFVAACADGAGSALRAEVGARLACQEAVVAALADIREGYRLCLDDPSRVRRWFGRARARLSHEACVQNVPSRDYACTLLLAAIDERGGLFGQVGDGAIVLFHEDRYNHVFWPDGGEYANQTTFLTDPDFDACLQLDAASFPLDRVALFSDGLQRLALHEATRTAHGPFFVPLFAKLLATADAATLEPALRRWLGSDAINQRTDDDKTLLLAVRGER